MSNSNSLVSRVIDKLHQHKAKDFGKLRYAPNFEKAKRFVLCWDSQRTPAETQAIKAYIETLKAMGKQVVRIVYFNVKTKEETPLVPGFDAWNFGHERFECTAAVELTGVHLVHHIVFDPVY